MSYIMRIRDRLAWGFLLSFCWPFWALAQFTNVSGTVTDTNGVPYDCGTITATIVNNNGQNLYLNGQLYTPAPSPVQLGCIVKGQTSGSFLMSVGDNTQIKCGSGLSIVTCGIQTQWTFQAAIAPGILPPGGTGPQTCSTTVTISGSSQTVTFANCPALSKGGAGAPAKNVITISQTCSGANCFQSPWNTRQDVTCAWNAGNTTLTCLDAPFASGDVGKNVALFDHCQTTLAINAITGSVTSMTIAGFVSSSTVTLSRNPDSTLAGSGCLYWGNPDDAATTLADNLAQASPTCPAIELPMGIGMWLQPHFFTSPNSCLITPENSAAAYLEYGLEVKGQGPQNTTIFWPPYFNFAGCTHTALATGCMGTGAATNASVYFHDWGITGGGLSGASNASTVQLIVLGGSQGLGFLDKFLCSNMMAAANNFVGVQISAFHGLITNSGFDGCGATAVEVGTSGAALLFGNDSFADSKSRAMVILAGTSATSIGGGTAFQPSPQSTGGDTIENHGGLSLVTGDGIFANGSGVANRIAYHGYGNSSLVARGVAIQSGNGNTERGIQLDTAGGVAILTNVGVSSTGSVGFSPILLNQATVQIFDYCGNSAPTGSFVGAGTQIGDCSATGTAQVATGITPSTGWGTTGAAGNGVSNVSGRAMDEVFTITAAGAPAANPTIAVVFPAMNFPLLTAPTSCLAKQIGGTGVIQQLTTTTGPSTTGVTFTWVGTPVAAQTYIISMNCSNK